MFKKLSQKVIIWVVIVATLLVVLFSAVFVGKYLNHRCDDENCPICEMMVECETNLKLLGTAIILLVATGLVLNKVKSLCVIITKAVICNSLISQKVRLNN